MDTSWKSHQTTVNNVYPTATQTIPYKVTGKDTFFIPDTNYHKLRIQFDSLRDMFLAENIYKQTLKSDSSTIDVSDTIFKNRIKGSGYKFNLKYPVITNTTIIKEPYVPTRQVYVGGSINGNQNSFINMVDAGFLYKTKTDRVFQLKAGIDITGKVNYGVGSYWKIKL